MGKWHEVTTLMELEAFLTRVGAFHDGIIKEVHWVNRDWVGEDLGMRPYQLAHARILVQRQWKNPSAVEMAFDVVWRLRLDAVHFVFDSTAREEESSRDLGEPRRLLVLEMESSEIAFERMRWRDASEWMGPDVRFGSG